MPNILIVDDEKHIPQDLSFFLKKAGHETYLSYSVEEAKQIIEEQHLDYAIVDLKLDNQSDFSGIEVFRQIRQRHPSAKIIVLSANPFLDRVTKEFLNRIKDLQGLDAEQLAEEIKSRYVYKGGDKNYILTVLDKLKELEE